MVLAYHAIFTAYGFWLPNDPRGSWSDFVRAWELRRFGPATKPAARRSVAGLRHDAAQRLAAKSSLRHHPVEFSGTQALTIARAFGETVRRSGYVLFACSILPDHVHIVVRRHQQRVEQIVGQLKGEATKRLVAAGSHPMMSFAPQSDPPPSPWARRCWKVFLNTPEDIERAIRYVEVNPAKEGKRPQRWKFVTVPATYW